MAGYLSNIDAMFAGAIEPGGFPLLPFKVYLYQPVTPARIPLLD